MKKKFYLQVLDPVGQFEDGLTYHTHNSSFDILQLSIISRPAFKNIYFLLTLGVTKPTNWVVIWSEFYLRVPMQVLKSIFSNQMP